MAGTIDKKIKVGWLNLDAWSETYVGSHWLVTEELPTKHYETLPRHGPLSQLVLLSAHHLVEVMFFQCVRSILKTSPGQFVKIEAEYERARFRSALEKWPEKLVGSPFEKSREPIKSIIRLSERRNATIHKDSALTSLAMARSALYSAVEASRTIAEHLLGGGSFKKYEAVLQKYPLPLEPWFSEIAFIDETI